MQKAINHLPDQIDWLWAVCARCDVSCPLRPAWWQQWFWIRCQWRHSNRAPTLDPGAPRSGWRQAFCLLESPAINERCGYCEEVHCEKETSWFWSVDFIFTLFVKHQYFPLFYFLLQGFAPKSSSPSKHCCDSTEPKPLWFKVLFNAFFSSWRIFLTKLPQQDLIYPGFLWRQLCFALAVWCKWIYFWHSRLVPRSSCHSLSTGWTVYLRNPASSWTYWRSQSPEE